MWSVRPFSRWFSTCFAEPDGSETSAPQCHPEEAADEGSGVGWFNRRWRTPHHPRSFGRLRIQATTSDFDGPVRGRIDPAVSGCYPAGLGPRDSTTEAYLDVSERPLWS